MDERTLKACHEAVRRARPRAAHANVILHANGWDCVVLEVDGWMFKFPRHREAEARLKGEQRTLAFARRITAVSIPQLAVTEDDALTAAGGPACFSIHRAIPGQILLSEAYARLGEREREALCEQIASTFAAFHGANPLDARRAGVPAAPAWPPSEALDRVGRASCDGPTLALARGVLHRWEALRDDETVFGHFDTHGWNMALDETGTRLVGLFDFGHSGTGPLHRDLSYPAFVSVDCALRVARHYSRVAGRAVDLPRILNTHAVLRLVELFQARPHQVRERVAVLRQTLDDIAGAERGRGI